MTCPVMKLARGEHRNSTGSTTSSQRAEPPGRDQIDQGLALVGMVGQVLTGQLRVHVARGNRVGGHAVGRVLVRDHSHQLVDRALGGGVRPVQLVAAAAGHRREEDDAPVSLLSHAHRRLGGEVKRAGQVHAHDPVPLVGGVTLDRLAIVDADAMHEHVESGRADRAPVASEPARGVGLAQIGLHGRARRASRHPSVSQVDHTHARTRIQEPGHERAPDRSGPSRNHDALSREPEPVRHPAALRDG